MINYKFGDVILVPFPFTNLASNKKRPAIIISSTTYHKAKKDVIIMAITSQMKPIDMLKEVVIKDWSEAGLLKPSVIKAVIATIESSIIIKKMGKLAIHDKRCLKQMIGCMLEVD